MQTPVVFRPMITAFDNSVVRCKFASFSFHCSLFSIDLHYLIFNVTFRIYLVLKSRPPLANVLFSLKLLFLRHPGNWVTWIGSKRMFETYLMNITLCFQLGSQYQSYILALFKIVVRLFVYPTNLGFASISMCTEIAANFQLQRANE